MLFKTTFLISSNNHVRLYSICNVQLINIFYLYDGSWSCVDEGSSTPKPHPLCSKLGLLNETIAMIESSECRVTVATTSGKLATFYDALLRGTCKLRVG